MPPWICRSTRSLATDYFALRAEDTEEMILDQTVEAYRTRSLQLTQNLYNGGGAALADVAQARAQLETARTQAADIRLQQRARAPMPSQYCSAKTHRRSRLEPNPLPSGVTPPPIDPGLPSALLERRPDVAAAERRASPPRTHKSAWRGRRTSRFSVFAAAAGFDSTSSSNWLTATQPPVVVGPRPAC